MRRNAIVLVVLLVIASCSDDTTIPLTTTPAVTTTPATMAATTTKPPEAVDPSETTAPTPSTTEAPAPPEVGWMAWEFDLVRGNSGTSEPCLGCSGGVTPIAAGGHILRVDDNGEVWATDDEGLLIWDPLTGKSRIVGTADGLLDTTVFQTADAPDGSVWIATYGGANHWLNGRLTDDTLTNADGLIGNTTWDLWIDSTGTLWTDTNNGFVLSAWDGSAFRHYSTSDMASDLGNGIGIEGVFPGVFPGPQFGADFAQDAASNLWFATTEGVRVYDSTDWTAYRQPDPLPSDSVEALAVGPTGSVWVGTLDGIVVYDGANWSAVEAGPSGPSADDTTDTITFALDGSVWLAGSFGLWHGLEDDWEFIDGADGVGVGSADSIVAASDGSIWVSSWDGIARYGVLLDVSPPAPGDADA